MKHMAMEDIELDVGGTKFKGIYIAILFSFASTLGGGIWAASEFFSRLEGLEDTVEAAHVNTQLVNKRFDDLKETVDDDLNATEVELGKVMQELEDNDVSGLQGKLATLGTNLQTIMDRQQELLAIQERIIAVEQRMAEYDITMKQTDTIVSETNQVRERLDKLQREIDDLWEGLDFLSNPYGSD